MVCDSFKCKIDIRITDKILHYISCNRLKDMNALSILSNIRYAACIYLYSKILKSKKNAKDQHRRIIKKKRSKTVDGNIFSTDCSDRQRKNINKEVEEVVSLYIAIPYVLSFYGAFSWVPKLFLCFINLFKVTTYWYLIETANNIVSHYFCIK